MLSIILNVFLCGIAVLGIAYIVTARKKENFISSPGIYPHSKGLIGDIYPIKKQPQLSHYSSINQNKLLEKYATGSYEQKTNNERYPEQPCNGRTMPSAFCESLYEKKTTIKPELCRPDIYCNKGKRVNFYCSKSSGV